MTLEKIREKIIPVLQANNVEYAAVFGSVARGEDKEGSDVDILVRFEPEFYKNLSLLDHIGIAQELEQVIGRKVDLITEKSLRVEITENVKKDLKVLYGHGQRQDLY